MCPCAEQVQYQCWDSSPKMSAYLKQRNMTGMQLYQEFEYRMFEILKGLGKDTVTWDSTFETGMTMPKNAVVHDYEGGNASVAKIAKAGVKVSLCLSLLLSLSLSLSQRAMLCRSSYPASPECMWQGRRRGHRSSPKRSCRGAPY